MARFVEHDHPAVREFADDATKGCSGESDVAVALYYAVRDGLRYDPYSVPTDPEDYRAGAIAGMSSGWCVMKAVLLCAAYRAKGLDALLGYADVRNHLQSERLLERMGTDVFVWHGYVSVTVDGVARKVTPAFNLALCERFGVKPLEFDGSEDALFHEATADGRLHMEYIQDRGLYEDLPFEEIMAAMRAHYPRIFSAD